MNHITGNRIIAVSRPDKRINAFIQGGTITSFPLPAEITRIAPHAFDNIAGLQEIVFTNQDVVVDVSENAGIASSVKFVVPEQLLDGYESAYPDRDIVSYETGYEYVIPFIGDTTLTAAYINQCLMQNPDAKKAHKVVVPVDFTEESFGDCILSIQNAFPSAQEIYYGTHKAHFYNGNYIGVLPNGYSDKEYITFNGEKCYYAGTRGGITAKVAFTDTSSVQGNGGGASGGGTCWFGVGSNRSFLAYQGSDYNDIGDDGVSSANLCPITADTAIHEFKMVTVDGKYYMDGSQTGTFTYNSNAYRDQIIGAYDTWGAYRYYSKMKLYFVAHDNNDGSVGKYYVPCSLDGLEVLYDLVGNSVVYPKFSTNMTREELIALLQSLETASVQRTLTIGATNLAKLTDEDIAIATSKNWQLA